MKMNFVSLGAALEAALLVEDYEAAEQFGKVSVGEHCVYLDRFFGRVDYLPLTQLERAFHRIEGVNAKVCCANASFDVHRLVLVAVGREVATPELAYESQVEQALAQIAAKSPATAIGYYK